MQYSIEFFGWEMLVQIKNSYTDMQSTKYCSALCISDCRILQCTCTFQTALHQAVRDNNLMMVKRLVAVPGCDVSIPDSQGNTPIHRAAQLSDHHCLEAVLTRPINGTRSAVTQALSAYNYDGEISYSGNSLCHLILYLLKLV